MSSASLRVEAGGAGIDEQAFETCSIIRRDALSTSGCPDLQKYVDISDSEREKRSLLLFQHVTKRLTDSSPCVNEILLYGELYLISTLNKYEINSA